MSSAEPLRLRPPQAVATRWEDAFSVSIRIGRSADFQSAVSQNSILLRAPETCGLPVPKLQPIGNRRCSRLEICATLRTVYWACMRLILTGTARFAGGAGDRKSVV